MRVHVIATGGTIASTADGGEAGAAPELSGDDLVDAVSDLPDCDLTVETLADRPSFDLGTDLLAAVCDRVVALADDVAGVVVTHGTDTLAESAYYVDLAVDADVPVVFTGAQRRPDETSVDGPANLRDASRAALLDRLDGGGYVAFDRELHAARDVTKAHTSSLSTFTSPESGPLALFAREGVDWYRDSPDSPTLDVHETHAHVPIVSSATGMPADEFDRARAGDPDGIVVAATGLGNVTAALGDAIAEADLPVVVASRCFAGPTAAVYGTPGGGARLRDAGARFAADLPPWKARIALLLAVAADRVDDFEELVAR
jgi:L-asparaginase